jgi:hypothetical protein
LIDVDRAQRLGTLVVLDAQHTLDRFMVNGMPDADASKRFEDVCRQHAHIVPTRLATVPNTPTFTGH